MMKYKSIIDQMRLEDKVALCSGADFFSTKPFEEYGIPSITMVDGPHGIRKQLAASDHLGINKSVPSTSFPTASLTACSWDRDLLREMGAAIAEEALQEGVSIVLGPGVNIKRNPLCGRNFEYFSEDPYLAGEMATAWIDGLQGKGVGASLKHFAANSQETERMSSDSLVDERTLREIYLPGFEKTVKAAKPATVMCAYNKLNGVYCSDNRSLLRDILRDEWGFTGFVVTDWGAMNDRVKAFEAGLDLEMPGSQGHFDEEIIAAIQNGKLSAERLNESVDRLLDLIFTCSAKRKPGFRYVVESHHLLAKKIAANSAVLLKNEGNILPIPKGQKIALIGALAKEARYQGAGSSHINPTMLSSAVDGFDDLGLSYTFFPGYPIKGLGDDSLLAEAVNGAKQSDLAVIFAGLPEEYESEGFDRVNLSMPESHNALIAKVADANPNTVVVLVGGAPVEMPWLDKVKAVLNMYLAGQTGGLAATELLTGAVNPSGKLAESYPIQYDDVPSAGIYETGGKQAQYREGIYVGYRYYDKAQQAVLFPFGHGLSYTIFEYSNLNASQAELHAPYELNISATITNTGNVNGAEVVQVYVGAVDSPVFRPEKELREFAKVFLKAGESKQVNFTLDARAFAVYDMTTSGWAVPAGNYRISLGASSRDIRLQGEVNIQGQALQPSPEISGWYANPAGKPSQADFETLLDRKIEPVKPWRKGEYTLACTFNDMKGSFIIRQVIKSIENTIAKGLGGVDYDNPTFKLILSSSTNTPLKNLSQLSPESMPKNVTQGLVHLANGKFIQAILAFIQKPKE
jgi:beta-glucosidase